MPFDSPLQWLDLTGSWFVRQNISACVLPPSDSPISACWPRASLSSHLGWPWFLHPSLMGQLPRSFVLGPNDENKCPFTVFPKELSFYILKAELLLDLLWQIIWSISEQMAHCPQGKNCLCLFGVHSDPDHKGFPAKYTWMLFLTHGQSAWWPRNMREPQGSGCEQLSLLWFSFFIMFDIFEAELFKKYHF